MNVYTETKMTTEELPFTLCEDDDIEKKPGLCIIVRCISTWDSSKGELTRSTCPAQPAGLPITCIRLETQVETVRNAVCDAGHQYGHTNTSVEVRLGCGGIFDVCAFQDNDETSNGNAPSPSSTTLTTTTTTTPPFSVQTMPPCSTQTTLPCSTQRTPPFSTQTTTDGEQADTHVLAFGLIAGCAVFIVIVAIAAFVIWYRRQRSNMNAHNLDHAKRASVKHVYDNVTFPDDKGMDNNVDTRKDSFGDYATIVDPEDHYHHCRPPSEGASGGKAPEGTDPYDSLSTGSEQVICDDVYNQRRDDMYDRLHTKEENALPGTYDVSPVQMHVTD